MRVLLSLFAMVVTAAAVTGCAEEPQYKGSSPSIRSMKDQAGMSDYYVGLDYKWALDRPSSNAVAPMPEARIQTPSPARDDTGDRFGSVGN